MPWQLLVANVGLELEANGLPAYREVIVTVPRQQGKTTLVLAVELHRALMWGDPPRPQRISYSAQTGWDGHKKLLDDQVPMLRRSPLWAMVERVFRAAGADGVLFTTGSRIDVMASGEAAGHGKVVDLAMIDEAFSDVDDRREQALKPAMMTKPDAQLWVTSTAGTEGSAYLKRKVDAGRSAVAEGLTSGIAYFEWSADDDTDFAAPSTWYSCMPALGHTVTEPVVAANLPPSMLEGEFRRSFLNCWTVSEERVIPAATWNACLGDVKPSGTLVFGLDVSPARDWASVVVADGERKAELVEHRDGTGWVVARLTELAGTYFASVAVDLRGPAASLIPELEQAGVTVLKYGSAEMATATARLFDDIADRKVTVRHHPDLDLAVAGARKRVSGDVWYFGRSSAHVDVSPLVALVLAYDAAVAGNREAELWVAWR